MNGVKTFACALAINIAFSGAALAGQHTPISLRLANADVSTVLRTLALMGGISLVVDESVTGKITLQLEGVPFDQALAIVTKSQNLAVQTIGNTLIVASPEKINKGFGSLHIIKLQYARAEDVKKSLALIVPEDKIKVNAAANYILFSGTPGEISEVERAVAVLDKELAQVIIEAEVLEINKNAMRDMGLSYDFKTIPYLDPPYNVKELPDGTWSKVYENKTHQRLKLFTVNGERINMGMRAALQAQISEGNGKVLAKPRIMALNNKDARIHIGNKIPIVEYDNEGNKTINYIDVGIKLDITPQISDNNTIISQVKTEISSAAYNKDVEAYEISTRESETTVRLQDGETLVIGGLYNSIAHQSMIKVPFLSDIPLLGNLFKAKSTQKRDTEIIVLLRPTIDKSK